MKKVLLTLLGLTLIGVISYFCFQDKIGTIRENLEVNANQALINNNYIDTKAYLVGNDFETTSVMKLTGDVPTEQDKQKAEDLVRSLSGISGVENQLRVANVVPSLESTPALSEVNVASLVTDDSKVADINIPLDDDKAGVSTPSPYIFDASKDENGNIVLNGYIDSEDSYLELMSNAYSLFGKGNITDNLNVIKGAPKNWNEVTNLSLSNLKDVDYGDMQLHDNNYAFNGTFISADSSDKKNSILKNLSDKMSGYKNFLGGVDIKIPEATKAKEEVAQKIETTPITPLTMPAIVELEEPVAKVEKVEKEETKPEAVQKVAKAEKPSDKIQNSKDCQKALNQLSSKQKIYFEYNSATIKKDSLKNVKNVINLFKECKLQKNEILEVGGHTDSIGSYNFNKLLSQKRANSVRNYMVKMGLDKKILKAKGYGERKPIVSNMLKTGRAKNRRIEFKIKEVK